MPQAPGMHYAGFGSILVGVNPGGYGFGSLPSGVPPVQAAPIPGAVPLKLDGPQTFHVPSWEGMGDRRRVAFIRSIAMSCGRDPRIRDLALNIVRAAGVPSRDYMGQASALLRWVQAHIYYANEPGEQLQDPLFTLRRGYGDCDDMVLLLASFLESVRLSTRLVISGRILQRGSDGRLQPTGDTVRWMEGQPDDPRKDVAWAHIYLAVGDLPFTPQRWIFCEPTLKVPLGWDVVQARNGSLPMPELGGKPTTAHAALGALDLAASANSLLETQLPVIDTPVRKLVEYAVLGIVSTLAGHWAMNKVQHRSRK